MQFSFDQWAHVCYRANNSSPLSFQLESVSIDASCEESDIQIATIAASSMAEIAVMVQNAYSEHSSVSLNKLLNHILPLFSTISVGSCQMLG